MNLVKVEHTGTSYHSFLAVCLNCNKRVWSSEGLFSDLEGEPFKAYYCHSCASIVSSGAIKSEEAYEFDALCERIENYSEDDSKELWDKLTSEKNGYKLTLAWQGICVLALAAIAIL